MYKALGAFVLLGVVVSFAMIPDFVRYLKIRAM